MQNVIINYIKMNNNNKKYWKGLAQLNNDAEIEKLAHNEFPEELPIDDFLSDDLSESKTSREIFKIFRF